MTRDGFVERVWYGTDPAARVGRAALAPLSAAFAAATAVRGRLYDARVFRAHPLALPALGVGNLTVGGTGKTPIAAWAIAEFAARGLRPAVVLRGVGDDETRVHALLNPGAVVVADADRVRGTAMAAARGANVVVLDDAFQHRRAARDGDVVLVAAETFDGHTRRLPAGPYRESLGAARRAQIAVVTRKSASPAQAARVVTQLERALDGAGVAVAVAHLAPDALVAWPGADGRRAAPDRLESLRGARVLAIAGIGAPAAFASQLRAVGADVTLARFEDHHAYDAGDVEELLERARAVDRVVTTLKDAVKLGPHWPHGAVALWYVTQRVTLEVGASALHAVLDRVASTARTAAVRAPHRSVSESAVRGRHA